MNLMSCAALSALLLLGTACAKRPAGVAPAPHNADGLATSLTGVRWQMASFTLDQPTDVNGDGRADRDLVPFLKADDPSLTITFGPDGSLAISAPGNTHSQPGTWSYAPSTKTLRMVSGDDRNVSEWRVVNVTPTALVVGIAITEEGQPLQATMTLKHS